MISILHIMCGAVKLQQLSTKLYGGKTLRVQSWREILYNNYILVTNIHKYIVYNK